LADVNVIENSIDKTMFSLLQFIYYKRNVDSLDTNV